MKLAAEKDLSVLPDEQNQGSATQRFFLRWYRVSPHRLLEKITLRVWTVKTMRFREQEGAVFGKIQRLLLWEPWFPNISQAECSWHLNGVGCGHPNVIFLFQRQHNFHNILNTDMKVGTFCSSTASHLETATGSEGPAGWVQVQRKRGTWAAVVRAGQQTQPHHLR